MVKWNKVTHVSLFISLIAMTLMAYGGYATFTGFVQGKKGSKKYLDLFFLLSHFQSSSSKNYFDNKELLDAKYANYLRD